MTENKFICCIVRIAGKSFSSNLYCY